MTLSEKWIDFFSSFSHSQIKPQPPLSQLLLVLWNVVLYISLLGRSWKQSKEKQNSLRLVSFEVDAEMVIFVLVSYWASSLEWETYRWGMGKSRRRQTPVGFSWSHALVCSHKKLQVVIMPQTVVFNTLSKESWILCPYITQMLVVDIYPSAFRECVISQASLFGVEPLIGRRSFSRKVALVIG